MSAEHSESQLARLNALSDRVFGEAGEIDAAEAEVLLQAAGIDPARLKSDLYERFKERSSTYAASGKPLPPRLRQALRDLEPSAQASSEESLLIRAGKLRVRRLLTEIKNLPLVLELEGTPAFTAAYRNRRELTARDKQVLDGIADELKAGPKATQSKQFSRQEPNGERPGAIYARILLKELGARHGAVQEVAAALGLKLREVESDGFDGALIRAQNAPLGTIVVRASIREKSHRIQRNTGTIRYRRWSASGCTSEP